MRIIAGEYKSRLIQMPKSVDIRPTQDKVRGAIFNILGDVTGANTLDLFAGSGACGIEALSRGCRSVTFVDNNSRCLETVRANLELLAVNESDYNIIKANALSVFPRLEKAGEKFDLIFLDPPYYRSLAKKCLINVDSCDILSLTGLVIAEHFRKDDLFFDMNRLVLEKERRYGDTIISIYRKVASIRDD